MMAALSNPSVINTLAQNGPWALMAGGLGLAILQAWKEDRHRSIEERKENLEERRRFTEAINANTSVMNKLADAVEDLRSEVKTHK